MEDHTGTRPLLSDEQVRVLGVLLEKERTTPDDYPLTANSVMRAANQSSSRDPVVSYDERLVTEALESLKPLGLVRFVHSPSNRSAKFRHVIDEAWAVDPAELSVMCLLALRGPQTPGELKTRSERLHPFPDVGSVMETLTGLASTEQPFVVELPRQPGQKEARWAHLLCGEPVITGTWSDRVAPRGTANLTADRLSLLEAEVAGLRATVDRLCVELGMDLLAEAPPAGTESSTESSTADSTADSTAEPGRGW